MTETIETRLRDLGIVLPQLSSPLGNYAPFAIAGNLLFVTAHPGQSSEGRWYSGKVGGDVSVQDAYEHARLSGLRMLAVVQTALGSLDQVERVVRLTGFVNASPDFSDHPRVIDGCSDLLVQVFGEAGRHSRSAVGASSLPADVTVEIEATFRIR